MPGLSRYANVRRHRYDGHTFDSKREMLRYQELKLLERAGELTDLELQYPVKIVIGGIPVQFDNGRTMVYRADFRYYDTRAKRIIYEDVKGHPTEVYKIKKALVRAMGIDILETK